MTNSIEASNSVTAVETGESGIAGLVNWAKGVLPDFSAETVQYIGILTGALIAAFIIYVLYKHICVPRIRTLLHKSKHSWDDVFVENRVFGAASYLIFGLVIFIVAGFAFPKESKWFLYVDMFARVVMCLGGAKVLSRLVKAIIELLGTIGVLGEQGKVLNSLMHVIQIMIWFTALLMIAATITNTNIGNVMGWLSGSALVLGIGFKDYLRDLFAGISLQAAGEIAKGEYLVFFDGKTKSGSIREIKSTKLEMCSSAQEIYYVPISKLTSNGFMNASKGLNEIGYRRIEQSIPFAITSQRVLSKERLEHLIDDELLGFFKEELQKIVSSNKAVLNSELFLQIARKAVASGEFIDKKAWPEGSGAAESKEDCNASSGLQKPLDGITVRVTSVTSEGFLVNILSKVGITDWTKFQEEVVSPLLLNLSYIASECCELELSQNVTADTFKKAFN